MEALDWTTRITVDPTVGHGRPCVKGTRIWVSLILDLLASGSSVEDIIDQYPHITDEDVRACNSYGAAASRERFIPVAMGE